MATFSGKVDCFDGHFYNFEDCLWQNSTDESVVEFDYSIRRFNEREHICRRNSILLCNGKKNYLHTVVSINLMVLVNPARS